MEDSKSSSSINGTKKHAKEIALSLREASSPLSHDLRNEIDLRSVVDFEAGIRGEENNDERCLPLVSKASKN